MLRYIVQDEKRSVLLLVKVSENYLLCFENVNYAVILNGNQAKVLFHLLILITKSFLWK